MLWPDADHTRVRKGSIVAGTDAMMFGPHTARLLRAAVGTGIDARASRDAGSYLCNYLSWRAIEARNATTARAWPRSSMCPLLARDGASRRKGMARITLDELVDAGEAMLLEMVKLTRQAARKFVEWAKRSVRAMPASEQCLGWWARRQRAFATLRLPGATRY